MNNKKLAEMIKVLRNKKLKEQNDIKAQSKKYLERQKFNPVHVGPKGDTPNRYAHGMEETFSTTIHSGVGGRHNPRMTIGNKSKLFSDRTYQFGGNQLREPKTYGNTPVSEEETEKLGPTDTKRKTQSIMITPEIEPFGKQ